MSITILIMHKGIPLTVRELLLIRHLIDNIVRRPSAASFASKINGMDGGNTRVRILAEISEIN